MDFAKKNFIGKVIEITKPNSNIGLKGTIIDETKYSFSLNTTKGKKVILKKNLEFITEFQGKKINIKGSDLIGAPKDRIKK